MISVEVKSSGWGPRVVYGVPSIANAHWRRTLLEDAVHGIGDLWPRDGVAIIIRREM